VTDPIRSEGIRRAALTPLVEAGAPVAARPLVYGGNVWRLFTAQALLMFILWVPIWVVFLQSRGVSLTQIGLLEGVAWVLTAFLEVPTGAVADRWGRKASIAIGAALYAMAMFLILAKALSPAFLLGYALWNSSMAFVSGADAALLYDTLKADGREDQAAKQSGRYAAIQQGSQGLASVAGAAIATIDITLCFTLCGVAALIAAVLVLTIKEPPHVEEGGPAPLSYWKNLRTAVGIAARRPVVRALLLLYATILTLPLVVYYVLLQPYALGVGLPIATLGVVVAGVQLTSVVASWLAYRASRRFALTSIMAVGLSTLLVAQVLLTLFPSLASIALMLPVALVPALLGPLLLTRINDVIPSAQRATILSLSALTFELGLAVAMPLLLTSADRLGAPGAVGIATALFAVTAIPLLVIWRAAERTRGDTGRARRAKRRRS
jgi:predicted MFS family arabinose efflux permease